MLAYVSKRWMGLCRLPSNISFLLVYQKSSWYVKLVCVQPKHDPIMFNQSFFPGFSSCFAVVFEESSALLLFSVVSSKQQQNNWKSKKWLKEMFSSFLSSFGKRGFEPSVILLLHRRSRSTPSTTRTSFHSKYTSISFSSKESEAVFL